MSESNQHNDNQLSYDNLLKQYRELQLRVTRFSAVEQELINTRDRLDYELVLHQRLHRYNSDALKESNEAAFFQIESEAVVDIFEMECSMVLYVHGIDKQLTIYKEGIHTSIDSNELLAEAQELALRIPSGKATMLTGERLNQHVFFSQFAHGLFSHFAEATLNYQVYTFGFVSKTNSPLYNKPSDRHLTILGVFTQQLQAMLANRKRSEAIEEQIEQIRSSQQELRKLSLIATRTKNGVIITDSMGRIEWVNDAFTKISGYELNEVLGKKPKDLLQGPKTEEAALEQLKQALWNKQNIEVTVVNYDREGREYFNQLEIISVFNEEGEHTNFIALQKDITEEILARQEIIRINTRFELIAKHSRIGTWEYNTIDGSIRWNNIMFEIYGVDEKTETPLGQIWRDSMSQEDYEQGLINLNSIRAGLTSSSESTFLIKRYSDGAYRTVETLLVAERDDKGQLLRVVGSTKDITEEITLRRERDAAAERMISQKTFYESILNHSPSQKFVFDAEGLLLFCTEPPKEGALWMRPMYGTSIFEMEETSLDSRALGMISHIRKSLESGQLLRVEDEGIQHDGNKVEFLQSILPYYNESGKLEHIIVTGVDISELKKVQEAVTRKNEELRKINAELDNFVYSISHDLRSPLLSIKGIVSLILDSPHLDEKDKNYLQMVDGSA
ncbi:MAG: PAS domain S-box protein, partial [Flavobacteriales bacterium]